MAVSTQHSDSIDTRSLSQQVYDHLCDQIIRGRISYGARLNIKRMAEQLKVSPMPIRDALKRLEMENIVEVKARSTCFVKVPTKKSVLDSIEARKMLEMAAVRKIYRSVEPGDLGPLFGLVNRMEEALEQASSSSQEDLHRYIDLDRLFHKELCRLANNEYLEKFYREVNLHLNMQYRYGIGAPFDIQATMVEHKELAESLAQHSEKAIAILDRHLRRSRRNIVSGETYQSLPD